MPLPHPTTFSGHIVDIPGRRIYDGTIIVSDGTIAAITPCDGLPADAPYLLPGFIDSHVHIESSMMTPAAFAAVAVRHGTVGAVADPHEIANVLGTAGIDFMTDNARQAAFHFCFGAPSCVPSCGTDIETAGACLDSKVLATLLARPDIGFLAEMMNYVGVLATPRSWRASRRHAAPANRSTATRRDWWATSAGAMPRRASRQTTNVPPSTRDAPASRRA